MSEEPSTETLASTVDEHGAGKRLDRFVGNLAEVGSRSAAERLLAGGSVTVDGRVQPKSYRLHEGERVEVGPITEPAVELVAENVEFLVRYEDEHLLVVDKPAGVVVHPGAGHAHGTLVHGLVSHGAAGGPAERPGIVHRLDQHTSGLLVVARSAKAHRRLSESIAAREVKREYVALVKGRPLSWEGRIDAPIGRDRGDASRQSLDTNAPREAMTHFVVEELIGPRARLKVELGTGRTHQIRVHLAAIDLPICGDPTYGVADDLGLSRQFLHAARLVLEHPFTADELDVDSPLPDDLSHALDDARRAQPTQDRLEGAPATVG